MSICGQISQYNLEKPEPGPRILAYVLVKQLKVEGFIVFRWQNTFPVIETSTTVLRAALDLTVDHRLTIWDAIILACAAENGCRLLLSEDLQDGFTWNGVTVANPFAAKKHALLAGLLE